MQYWCSMALIDGVYSACSTGAAWLSSVESSACSTGVACLSSVESSACSTGAAWLSYRWSLVHAVLV